MTKKEKKGAARVSRTAGNSQQITSRQIAPPKLKLLITVVNREKTDVYLELLRLHDVNMQLATAAQGTASAEMLRYLGLSSSDKSVIFSIIREDRAASVLHFLEERFQKIKNGKGIAFTVPVSSVIGVLAYRFLSNNTGIAVL